MWILEDRVLVGKFGCSHALSDDQYRRHALDRRRDPVKLRSLYQLGRAALLVAAITFLAIPRTPAWGAVPQGVWLIDEKAAVQISSTAMVCYAAAFFGCRFRGIHRVSWAVTRIIRIRRCDSAYSAA